ncbi:hypothetical protein K443DRAFT_117112 [Laccaria amethystina LaAM-08-1]|uniref:Uncharacterized protein n=1 Tax=Laccaria amethystina LaAM-08-1 TaxID=1095629 RepID=A0A0C9WL91_9AGAR|nr:hypothetical protein K443DRAFT_117112 [Laccaria amethystina LaAM-08-1]
MRDRPSSAQASTVPFRSSFLTCRILYAKALHPYQLSVTADLSSEVRPALSFIQRVKLTLCFAKGKVKTVALSITLCYCLELNLPPFPSLVFAGSVLWTEKIHRTELNRTAVRSFFRLQLPKFCVIPVASCLT